MHTTDHDVTLLRLERSVAALRGCVRAARGDQAHFERSLEAGRYRRTDPQTVDRIRAVHTSIIAQAEQARDAAISSLITARAEARAARRVA